jgi:hypothetical protein
MLPKLSHVTQGTAIRVNGGTSAGNGIHEHGPQVFIYTANFLPAERTGTAPGMNSRMMQALLSIDITHPGNHLLVHENLLDCTRP